MTEDLKQILAEYRDELLGVMQEEGIPDEDLQAIESLAGFIEDLIK